MPQATFDKLRGPGRAPAGAAQAGRRTAPRQLRAHRHGRRDARAGCRRRRRATCSSTSRATRSTTRATRAGGAWSTSGASSRRPDGSLRQFRRCGPTTRAEEKAAFVAVHGLRRRAPRQTHPDMHIYHYAPYETTALKRLAARYQTHETELDDLLRSAVFVDLYATVRGAVRVSAAVVQHQEARAALHGRTSCATGDVAGRRRLDRGVPRVPRARGSRRRRPRPRRSSRRWPTTTSYDCLSTLRLRDWLLERAAEAGVARADRAASRSTGGRGGRGARRDPVRPLRGAGRAGEPRPSGPPDEQAYAMLATALGYHRREHKPFWWEHFDRLRDAGRRLGRARATSSVVDSRRGRARTGHVPDGAGRPTRGARCA